MVNTGVCQLLTTLAFATPPRRPPDMLRMQLSPLHLPERVGRRLQRSRQRPQYLEQLGPAQLPTEAQLPTSDDASDAPSAPPTHRRRRHSAGTELEEATVDLWTYQAPGGVAAWSKRPCPQLPMRPTTAQEGHLLARGYPLGPVVAPSPLGCGEAAAALCTPVPSPPPSPWPCRCGVGRGGQPLTACTLAAVRARSTGRRARAPLHARAANARQPRHVAH